MYNIILNLNIKEAKSKLVQHRIKRIRKSTTRHDDGIYLFAMTTPITPRKEGGDVVAWPGLDWNTECAPLYPQWPNNSFGQVEYD